MTAIKKVKVKEKIPLRYLGHYTWYDKGDILEVVEEKELELVGKCYKLKYAGCVFDGYFNADMFEVIQ